MDNLLKELFKELGKSETIDVYRGTISKETLEHMETAKREMQEAHDKFMASKKELWNMVYSELGLEPKKHYFVESHTGQIFEKVPKSELESKDEEPQPAVNE